LRNQPNQVLLTFDVEGLPPREDFLDNAAIICLHKTLDLLENADLEGVFFITASAAEQIRKHPDLVGRLASHQIGYHSTSHSVRPWIIEYTDVPSYDEALAISSKRETSHINPKTGQIEGKGGILALRETFPKNDIVSFRAPFLAWSPPHLEGLKKLGIQFDFSASISDHSVSFRGLTFYPLPIPIDDCVEATFVRREPNHFFPKPIFSILMRRKVTVLSMHPTTLLVKNAFAGRDKYQIGGNVRTKFIISLLRLLLNRICILQKGNLIQVTSSLSQNWQSICLEKTDVERIYLQSVRSLTHLFNCSPRFVLSHFMHFFDHDFTKSAEESSNWL